MQQKYEKATTQPKPQQKIKSNRNIFAWNGLKRSKENANKNTHTRAHTTKRNVCVMYGKYVHCTHTHTRTDIHMDMFYSGIHPGGGGSHKYFI